AHSRPVRASYSPDSVLPGPPERQESGLRPAPCGRGGTGRRASLRCLWEKSRGGSSPLDRTIVSFLGSLRLPAGSLSIARSQAQWYRLALEHESRPTRYATILSHDLPCPLPTSPPVTILLTFSPIVAR